MTKPASTPKKPKAAKVAKTTARKMIPLSKISIHPILAAVDTLPPDESEELQLLAKDIAAHGVAQDVFVVVDPKKPGHWQLVDGRRRFAGSRLAGKTEIPAMVRKEEEVLQIVLSMLALRKHFTKGALAYSAFPLICNAQCKHGGDRKSTSTESTLIAQQSNNTDPDPFPTPFQPFSSAATLAITLGVSRDLFFQAAKVHEIFAEAPDYKALMEPQILFNEVGLGAVIAGYAGRKATKKPGKPTANYLALDGNGRACGLIPKALITLENGFKVWPKLDIAARAALKSQWDRLNACIPEDLLN